MFLTLVTEKSSFIAETQIVTRKHMATVGAGMAVFVLSIIPSIQELLLGLIPNK
jgi:hypothetical protein